MHYLHHLLDLAESKLPNPHFTVEYLADDFALVIFDYLRFILKAVSRV